MTKETLNVCLVAIESTAWKGTDLDQVYKAKEELKKLQAELPEKKK